MDERKPHQLSHLMVGVNLGDGDLIVGREPTRYIDRAHGHIQQERCTQPRVVRPLRHRLEVVHRFAGFNLDHTEDFAALFKRKQHHIGVLFAGRAKSHILLGTGVDPHFDLPAAELALKLPDYAIVLELLTYGSHQDRTQRRPPALIRSTKPAYYTQTPSGQSPLHVGAAFC